MEALRGETFAMMITRCNGSLTGIERFPRVCATMKNRFISLGLLLMLAGSAFAGMPLRSHEESCSMGGAMGDMDCCKVALKQSQTPAVAAARLCCAVNCSTDGTVPAGSVRISPPQQAAVPLFHTSTPGCPQALLVALRLSRAHGPASYSNPAYIRNLALLI